MLIKHIIFANINTQTPKQNILASNLWDIANFHYKPFLLMPKIVFYQGLLFFAILAFVGTEQCIQKPDDLNGHWRIYNATKLENKWYWHYNQLAFTIDIEEDTMAIMNKNSFYGGIFGGHHTWSQLITIGGECYYEEFTYELEGDNLFLENAISGEVYIGKREVPVGFTRIQEYFKDKHVHVNLKILPENLASKIDTNELLQDNWYSKGAFFGIPKFISSGFNCYASKKRLVLNNKFSFPDDIPLWIHINEVNAPKNFKKPYLYKIFADKTSTNREIREIVEQFQKAGIKDVWIAYLKSNYQTEDFPFCFVKSDYIFPANEKGY